MVFHKALPFTRLTLGKSLSHGPQSVVASSQLFNPTHPFNNRFQKYHAPSHSALNAIQNNKSAKDSHDAAFADYLKKWHRDQRLGASHYRQYQIYKPLEWKPRELPADSKAAEEQAEAEASEDVVSKTPARVQTPAVTESIDQQVERVSVEHGQLKSAEPTSLETTSPQNLASTESVVDDVFVEESASSITVTSFSEQLSSLLSTRHYAEIPAVFQALLSAGIKPSANDYNALLSAAIHHSVDLHVSTSKALDVYSDMLQRNVLPAIKTYTILVEQLAVHALHVDSIQSTLDAKRIRYGGLEKEGSFLFKSNASEQAVLSQDQSLAGAMDLFDTALSIHPQERFPERTYRLLISACAAHKKIPEMVNVYSRMESQGVVPSADTFVRMIPTFALAGDMNNAVEMYNEYKQLAIRNNDQEIALVRKDDDVYASLIKAYNLVGDRDRVNEFMSKLETSATSPEAFKETQDSIALKALLPVWLDNSSFDEALSFAKHKLGPRAREIGLAAVCIRAADRNNFEVASEAFGSLSENADILEPAFAMSAMHIRSGNLEAAERFWSMVENSAVTAESLELATMHAVAFIGSNDPTIGLQRLRSTYARLRHGMNNSSSILNKIDESVDVIGYFMRTRNVILPVSASVELLAAMAENGTVSSQITSQILAAVGPEEIANLDHNSLEQIAQSQASMLVNVQQHDIANAARFSYIVDMLIMRGARVSVELNMAIEAALPDLDRPDTVARWQAMQYGLQDTLYSPVPPSTYMVSPVQPSQPTFEDSHDPYAATTDNKGSVIITDLLEKTHGRFTNHLNEALVRFRNVRRAGRHPRFFTYAKLIAAAAKDNRIQLAHEILALARQDVPYMAQYRIVRFGWVSILDSMVAACLQTGQRHLAEQFHQELRVMGASPSANTFGLYITTLKESTKTFDEASEAVKIFLQAKNEGVEPTSFLYNALIGKLGKARRIDDCLFYFQDMRRLGIRPTSVTYGTIVNALCRVSDEKFAEELFEEMENMPNYKPRPAPYHSMMQFFLSTKRDRSKVLDYYGRMRQRNIPPTAHTFKLLIDTHATLEPVDMTAAENVIEQIRAAGMQPDAVHYASLIHANGCVAHNLPAARALFDKVMASREVRPQPCLYQALFESMVANHSVADSDSLVSDMRRRGVELTPYIANALIHGWAVADDVSKAEAIFRQVPQDKREPSTYEAMTRAYMMADKRDQALVIVNEALARGYPTAVASKILDLVGTKAGWTPPGSLEGSLEGSF